MYLSKLHLHWRPSKYKGTTYRSYSLARAYRKDDKNRKEIVLPLGRLSDEDVKRWQAFVNSLKKPEMILSTFENIEVHKHYKYLNLAAVNHIWEDWKLDKPFSLHLTADVEPKIIKVKPIMG